MKFLADDGKVFENRTECEKYEKEIGIRRLNHKCITMPLPFVETSTGYECIFELFDIRNYDDFKFVKKFYENIYELYGFDDDELERFTRFPFTAVTIRRDTTCVDLLPMPKEKVIEIFELFITELKKA